MPYFTLKDLELENQDLKGRMREVQEEQRMLLDTISGLQLQLTEVNQGWECLAGKLGQPLGSGFALFPWQSLPCVCPLPAGKAFGPVVPPEW